MSAVVVRVHGATIFNYPERGGASASSAIKYGGIVRAGRPAPVILKTGTKSLNKVRLPAIHFPIRRPLSADTGALIAVLRSLSALRFNSFRLLAGWSFHALLKFLQEPSSGIVKRLQVLFLSAQTMGLAASLHGQQHRRSETKCPNQDGTNPYRYRAKA